MYITTLQAIDIAIQAIEQLPSSEKNKQAIIRLTNMKQDKYIHWTKESVFKQLDDWVKTHNRNPTVTNLTETNMPKAVTIQKLFDMKASAFLRIYYPSEKHKANTNKYSIKTKEEWISDFTHQFNKIQPYSAKDYDTKRDKSSPTWLTIARYLNVSTWNELLELTNVDTKCLCLRHHYQARKKEYIVDSTSALYNKLENIINDK